MIQRAVQDPLAEKMLAGEIVDGDRVMVTGGTDRLLFTIAHDAVAAA